MTHDYNIVNKHTKSCNLVEIWNKISLHTLLWTVDGFFVVGSGDAKEESSRFWPGLCSKPKNNLVCSPCMKVNNTNI